MSDDTTPFSIRGLVFKIILSLLAGFLLGFSLICLMAIANPALADRRTFYLICLLGMGFGLGQLLRLAFYWVMGEL